MSERPQSPNDLPETILQIGSGKFLRAFTDLFVHEANRSGKRVGRIVAVQTTGEERARLLNQQGGKFHVVVRGLAEGALVDRTVLVESVSRALTAARDWPAILELSRSPGLRFLISNTAEAGYTLAPSDTAESAPPASFPAKLLLTLKERFQAGQGGLVIVPCELHEGNADLLQAIVLELLTRWNLSRDLADWIKTECVWLNTLVDRIVTGKPLEHPLLASDPLLTVAEPYALWAVQEKAGSDDFLEHTAVRRTPDVQPFFLRKVRILNAAHTALVGKCRDLGVRTVREAVEHPVIGEWLNRLLFGEIVPTLEGRVEAPEEFARQTLERFRNPFLEHNLADIAVYHDAKVRIRLLPTRAEYVEKFGRTPRLLDEAIGSIGE